MDLMDALASLAARSGMRRTKHRPELMHDDPVTSGDVLGNEDPDGPLGIQGALEAATAPRYAGAPVQFDEIDTLLAQIIMEQRMRKGSQMGLSLTDLINGGQTSSAFNLGATGGASSFDPFNISSTTLSPSSGGGSLSGGLGPG